MNYRHALVLLALTLGGCASYSSDYNSRVVYQDGSYYSPAETGQGDYYYAPEPRYYDGGFYDSSFFYGASLYGFGGYGSVRYSYCPSLWSNQFLYPFSNGFIITSGDNGWFDPYWGGYGYGYGDSSGYPSSYDRRPRPASRDGHRLGDPSTPGSTYSGPWPVAEMDPREVERFGDSPRRQFRGRMGDPAPPPLRAQPLPRPVYQAPQSQNWPSRASDSSDGDTGSQRGNRRRSGR